MIVIKKESDNTFSITQDGVETVFATNYDASALGDTVCIEDKYNRTRPNITTGHFSAYQVGDATFGSAVEACAAINAVINFKSGGGTGGGIPDAPIDGKQYGRQNGGWTETTGGGGDIPDIDQTPTEGSQNLVTSGGVFDAINASTEYTETEIDDILDRLRNSDADKVETTLNTTYGAATSIQLTQDQIDEGVYRVGQMVWDTVGTGGMVEDISDTGLMVVRTTVTNPDEKAKCLKPLSNTVGSTVDLVTTDFEPSDNLRTGTLVWTTGGTIGFISALGADFAVTVTTISVSGSKTGATIVVSEMPNYANASILKTLADGFFPKTFSPSDLSYRGSAPGFKGDEFIVPEDGFYAIEYGTAGTTLQGVQVLTCITVNGALEVSDYRIIPVDTTLAGYVYLSTGYKRRNKGDVIQMTAARDQQASSTDTPTTLSGRTCLLYAPIKRVPLSAITTTSAELTQLIADGNAVIGQMYYVTDGNTQYQSNVPTVVMIRPDGTPEYLVSQSELVEAVAEVSDAVDGVSSELETHISGDASLYQSMYKAIMSEVQNAIAGTVPVYDMDNPEVVSDAAGALIAVDLGKTWTAPTGGKLVMIYKATLLGVSPVVTQNGTTIFSDGLGILGLTNGEPVTVRITVGDVIEISGSLGLLTSFNATFYPSVVEG